MRQGRGWWLAAVASGCFTSAEPTRDWVRLPQVSATANDRLQITASATEVAADGAFAKHFTTMLHIEWCAKNLTDEPLFLLAYRTDEPHLGPTDHQREWVRAEGVYPSGGVLVFSLSSRRLGATAFEWELPSDPMRSGSLMLPLAPGATHCAVDNVAVVASGHLEIPSLEDDGGPCVQLHDPWLRMDGFPLDALAPIRASPARFEVGFLLESQVAPVREVAGARATTNQGLTQFLASSSQFEIR
jgi:hypothetical protein